MNFVWNSSLPSPNIEQFTENLQLFCNRFPQLSNAFGFKESNSEPKSIKKVLQQIQAQLSSRVSEWQILPTKSDASAFTISCAGKFIHSKYNPVQEAKKIATGVPAETEVCIFPGLGLGYIPEAWIALNPQGTAIIIEPDAAYLFLLLLYSNCKQLFSHQSLILMVESTIDVLFGLLQPFANAQIYFLPQPSIAALNKAYYQEAELVLQRFREKNAINEATRKKFGRLWLHNMCRNLRFLQNLPGITAFKDCAAKTANSEGFPVLLLAAGPSLDEIRPVLADLAERCIVVCVDTALRFCLACGVQPDFTVLIDPQYWNSRHITDLAVPETFLITESAAYPPVFRFYSQQTFLCSSLFPLGQFLESRCGENGKLGTGGSVATTAWDFARYMGSPLIYVAGLDLSFPDGKTHAKGSLFEERIHSDSGRLHPAETSLAMVLYGNGRVSGLSYEGNSVITDRRMQLYAWWFESKITEPVETSDRRESTTATISDKGLRIPGIQTTTITELLSLPKIHTQKKAVLRSAMNSALNKVHSEDLPQKFAEALAELRSSLTTLRDAAKEGLAAVKHATDMYSQLTAPSLSEIRKKTIQAEFNRATTKMAKIESMIATNKSKELVSMIYSGSDSSNTVPQTDPVTTMLQTSKKLYTDLMSAAQLHISLLS